MIHRPAATARSDAILITTHLLTRRVFALALVLGSLGLMLLANACSAQVTAELQTFAGVNSIRVQAGLQPLKADADLTDLARSRSEDMATQGYFSHTPPNGCN